MRLARCTTLITALAAAAIAASPSAQAIAASPSARARVACTWTAFPIPVITDPNHRALIGSVAAASAREAWASGAIIDIRNPLYGPHVPLMLRWNGTRWRVVSASGPYGAVAALPGEAWATAGRLGGMLHWRGKRWSLVRTPGSPSSLSDVAMLSHDDVWAVGNGKSGPLVLHWDGSRWTRIAAPDLGGSTGVIAGLAAIPGTSHVWVYGLDPTTDEEAAALWTGNGWNKFALPLPAGVGGWSTGPRSIAASSASSAWIAMTAGDGHGHNRPFVLHWDGSTWSPVPTPNPGDNGQLHGVAAGSDSDAWLLGTAVSGKKGRPFVLEWDGSAWVDRSAPHLPDAAVAAVPGTKQVWVAGFTLLDLYRC